MRLGHASTSPPEGYYTDSDDDDDSNDDDMAANRDEQRAAKISATYLSLLRAYPRTLTSLKLSKLANNALPLFPPVAPLDLPHLATLELDMVTVPSGVFKWLTATARDLESLKVWLVTGITEADLLDYAQRKGRSLKQFAFKPKGKQGKKLANEMVLCVQLLSCVLTSYFCETRTLTRTLHRSQLHVEAREAHPRRQGVRPRHLGQPAAVPHARVRIDPGHGAECPPADRRARGHDPPH